MSHCLCFPWAWVCDRSFSHIQLCRPLSIPPSLLMATLLSSASSAAGALIDARVVSSTKRQYQFKLKHIEHFVSTTYGQPLTIPLNLDVILNFFGWLTETKHKDQPAAFSTVRQYKSALVWLYKEKKIIFPPEVHQGIETLLQGYKRKVSELKLAGKMPVFEGKHHLTYEGYRKLAESLLSAQPFVRTLFGWPYLVLQWNLLARTATVSAMMMEHVSWEGDALLVSTPKHKGDQEGVKCFARHVYANPLSPVICPVLALAVLIFTRVLRYDPDAEPQSLPNYRVFDGSSNDDRWSQLLGQVIGSLSEEDVRLLGAEKKQIGSHSVRKGGATYCAGMVNGPSSIQVFLRAGWSLGNVQDRYLFAGAGGDQLTGRALSGLPFTDSSFASLPPHFNAAGLELIDWPAVLPPYARFPQTFKRSLPFLLASICYHEQWLRELLPAHHPLFNTYLFASGAVAILKSHVLTGCGFCPVTGLTATGIPPHLAITNELTRAMQQTSLMKEALLSKCAELPSELVNVLLSKFSINGALPVTLSDLKAVLQEAVAVMRTELRQALPPTSSRAPAAPLHPDHDLRFDTWHWAEHFHPVPEGWVFPSIDAKAMWNLWHFGHVGDRIRPLRHLVMMDIKEEHVPTWSKASQVMRLIAEVMVEMGMVQSMRDVEKLSAADSAEAFDRAIVRVMELAKEGSTRGKRRWMEMVVSTMYTLTGPLRKKRKQERKERSRANQ